MKRILCTSALAELLAVSCAAATREGSCHRMAAGSSSVVGRGPACACCRDTIGATLSEPHG